MRDGSDAIADWPILNALLNTASGASWVSVHHGGGVGIGNSIHAGMVIVCDGSAEADARLERVLTNDPGTGVMRHADAGYPEAIEHARTDRHEASRGHRMSGRGHDPGRGTPRHRRSRSPGGAPYLLLHNTSEVVTPDPRGRTASCGIPRVRSCSATAACSRSARRPSCRGATARRARSTPTAGW